jgi:hypothetical protein
VCILFPFIGRIICVWWPHTCFQFAPLEDFDPLVDFDMTGGDDVWFVRLQLFFSCSLCPTGRLQDMSSHKEVSLVIFSTFEPISLTPDSCMQRNGIPMVYERAASQLPTLYVCPVENVLGRAPLLPCYLKGNIHNTFPWSLRHHVPVGAAGDSRQDSGTDSRLFRGQYLDVALWNGISKSNFGQGCRGDAQGARSRIKAQGSQNFKAPSLGSSSG